MLLASAPEPPMSTSPKFIPPAAIGASDRTPGGAIDATAGGRTDRRRSSSSRSPKSAGAHGGARVTARGRGELGGDSCGRSISPNSPKADSAAFCPAETGATPAGGYDSPTVGSSISPNPRPPPAAAGAGTLSRGTGRLAAGEGRWARGSTLAGRDAATDGRLAPVRAGSDAATAGKLEPRLADGNDAATTGSPTSRRAG